MPNPLNKGAMGTWEEALKMAEVLHDDWQFSHPAGSVLQMDEQFQSAKAHLNEDSQFDPLLAAAIILYEAKFMGLIKEIPGENNGQKET